MAVDEEDDKTQDGDDLSRERARSDGKMAAFRRMFSTKATDITEGGVVKSEPLSSWLILVATFLVNVLIATADTIFGILYDYFTTEYDAPRAAVGWVLSAFAAASSLSGLIFSPFVVIYGCRPVGMASLFCMALGTCLSAYAPNLISLLMFYGVIGGAGWGGIYLVTSTIIQQTFSAHRGLATGIASLGFTTGTILSPILTNFLLTEFGLRGALMLLSAAYFQGLVFAMLLKTPKRLVRKCDSDNAKKPKTLRKSANANGGSGDSPSDVIANSNDNEAKATDAFLPQPTSPASDSEASSDETDCDDGGETADKRRSFIWIVKNMVDFRVFRKVTFVLAILYYLFMWMGRYITLSQTVGAAIHKGVPSQDAAYLLTIMGICNLFIRLISTVLLNCSWMNPVLYTALGTLFLSGAALFICWADSYALFALAMILLGFAEGLAVTVMPMVLVQIVGVTRFSRAWSILWMGLLPGTMAAGPFSGWLYDITGSYTPAFIVTTILGLSASTIAVVIFCLLRRSSRRKKRTEKIALEAKLTETKAAA